MPAARTDASERSNASIPIAAAMPPASFTNTSVTITCVNQAGVANCSPQNASSVNTSVSSGALTAFDANLDVGATVLAGVLLDLTLFS